LTARAAQARPHLDAAVRCARWIEQSAIRSGDAVSWPADPLRPGSIGYDHYNGMAGVVTFLAALHDAGGDPRWLDLARGGARTLRARLDGPPASHNDGLYTGLAGQAYALLMLERAGGGAEWGATARRATDLIVSRAKRLDGGVEWSSSWDIVSGIAGTGLFLLYAAAVWRDAALVETARLAGERLLATGTAAEGGTMWFPGAGVTRNYPNFSHGTSGVAYFLATLGQVTGARRFTDAALSGARYLDAIASRTGDAIAIFHVTGGGEQRYYLSWCHGPAGTARLFYRLHTLTGEPRWLAWVDGLTRTIARSGIPEERTEGYWNNVSQCCGNAGVGQYCIDLARHHPSAASQALVDRIVSNTLARATPDADGLKWIQAENRTQPENLVAQTGFMQGAAGIGTFFLQLDALSRGRSWRFPMPDTPFAGS
jgi:lantibiotic modifying enzyme